ncbi:MAG: hypothetical protein IJ506_00945 [Clostridia bacterium]|nr:hypothetical protein [Clostridia bacterium]
MQKKKFWVILLTVIVFLAGALLGVTNVYRVDDVVVKIDYVSEASAPESEALLKRLSKAYKGQSTLFVEKDEAKKIFEDFPYFRMTSFSTKHPNKVVIKATEDEEFYAFEKVDGGYYILGLDGVVLGERETSVNRSDGGENVLLSGFEATGEKGKKLVGDGVDTAIGFLSVLSEKLGGIRNNITKADWQTPASTATYLNLETVEGVRLLIENPQTLTKEKAERLAAYYTALEDGARLAGEVWVTSTEEGEIRIAYMQNGQN